MPEQRITDAQCLSAYETLQVNSIIVCVLGDNIVVMDKAKPMNERILWQGQKSDHERAEAIYKIEVMRPVLLAALNNH